jgi:uroporphyrinogen decarboxylase
MYNNDTSGKVVMLSSRERVICACRHQQPDRTPRDFGGTCMSLCSPEFLRMLRRELGFSLPVDRDDDGHWPDEAIQRYLNVDLRFVPYQPPLTIMRDLNPAGYKAEKQMRLKAAQATAQVKTSAVRHDFPLEKWSLEQIRTIQPNLIQPSPYLGWQIELAKGYRAAGYATTYWVSGGFFEVGCAMRGYEQFSMDLMDEPELVQTLFDVWLKEKLSQIEAVIRPLAPYIDIFCFGDDLGLQTGPFMSPVVFREQIKPYFQMHYNAVHAAAPDSLLFHHSCGSVYRLLDDLVDIGVNILNPIQPNAAEMEPERMKEKTRGRLCLHGGIDLQQLLPFGTPDEVRAEARRREEILGKGGGYICAAAHSLPEDVPVANILALFQK